jgi:hypothetical protein
VKLMSFFFYLMEACSLSLRMFAVVVVAVRFQAGSVSDVLFPPCRIQ